MTGIKRGQRFFLTLVLIVGGLVGLLGWQGHVVGGTSVSPRAHTLAGLSDPPLPPRLLTLDFL